MPDVMKRSHQVIFKSYHQPNPNASTSKSSSKAAQTPQRSDKITPPLSVGPPKESSDTTKMEEESIAIVSSNTSDVSSISSLSGGSFSTSTSSSSLQTTATSNIDKNAEDKSKGNKLFVSTIEECLAHVDRTPISYELSLSMYDGLLETCRPFYFPSEREQSSVTSSPNAAHKIPPRLEDALKMQKEEEERSSAKTSSRKRSTPPPLADKEKYGGRKVRVKTITFQEPSLVSRKKSVRNP